MDNYKDCVVKFFGVLKDTDWNEKEECMKKFRMNFNKRLKYEEK